MDFDKFYCSYKEMLNSSLGIFGKNDTFFDSYKITCIKDWLVKNDPAYDILDFGCGIGKVTALLARGFLKSTVYGYDISKECLSVAKKENAELKNVYFIDDLSKAHRFDLVMVAGVFHHIKSNEQLATMCRLRDLLKPGGRIIIFEHNPLNPLTCRIVNRCPFDSDAELIRCHKFVEMVKRSDLAVEQKLYVLFFPWSSSIFRKIEHWLRHIPVGAQYFIVASHK
jgi:2-polyprenyl-3-methyl-5-hydroxy-6-metoxy-1,4-benzoquinol methylase